MKPHRKPAFLPNQKAIDKYVLFLSWIDEWMCRNDSLRVEEAETALGREISYYTTNSTAGTHFMLGIYIGNAGKKNNKFIINRGTHGDITTIHKTSAYKPLYSQAERNKARKYFKR
jgi:hypothetical protein